MLGQLDYDVRYHVWRIDIVQSRGIHILFRRWNSFWIKFRIRARIKNRTIMIEMLDNVLFSNSPSSDSLHRQVPLAWIGRMKIVRKYQFMSWESQSWTKWLRIFPRVKSFIIHQKDIAKVGSDITQGFLLIYTTMTRPHTKNDNYVEWMLSVEWREAGRMDPDRPQCHRAKRVHWNERDISPGREEWSGSLNFPCSLTSLIDERSLTNERVIRMFLRRAAIQIKDTSLLLAFHWAEEFALICSKPTGL